MAVTAADIGIFFGVEEKDGPRVTLFIDMGNPFHVYKKRTMSLQENGGGQYLLQLIKGKGQSQGACASMEKGFFLMAFDKENFVQRDIIDSFGSGDPTKDGVKRVIGFGNGNDGHRWTTPFCMV